MTSLYNSGFVSMSESTTNALLFMEVFVPTTAQQSAINALPIVPSRINNKQIRNFIRSPLGEAVITDLTLLSIISAAQYTTLTGRNNTALLFLTIPERPALRRQTMDFLKYSRMFRRSLEVELAATVLSQLGVVPAGEAALNKLAGRHYFQASSLPPPPDPEPYNLLTLPVGANLSGATITMPWANGLQLFTAYPALATTDFTPLQNAVTVTTDGLPPTMPIIECPSADADSATITLRGLGGTMIGNLFILATDSSAVSVLVTPVTFAESTYATVTANNFNTIVTDATLRAIFSQVTITLA